MRSASMVARGVVALGLLVAGCGDDDDDAAETGTVPETTTTTTTVVETTTTTLPSAPVSATFASAVDDSTATQAADTMARRLDKFGYPGSTSDVNADGTGLDITVVGVETTDEARTIVEELNFRGSVLYRPVLAGPLPPTAGESPSSKTPEGLGLPPETDLTTVAGYDTPTTPPDQVSPDADAVLADIEFGTTNVIIRWQVGPAQLDGTATDNTQVTTSGGNNAVKVVMEDTPEGLAAFNAMAEACFDRTDVCPAGAYAIQFDGVIALVSSVRPDDASFTPFTQNDLIVSSSLWTEDEALLLAVALEAGALPTDLIVG